jgi:hypothetical protein
LTYRDSHIVAFVKAEKINLSAKQDPAPRIIQPRHPRFNLSVGVYIKKIEHRIYNIIKKVFHAPTVGKGMNALELGNTIADKWNKFNKPVAIGMDASRFDQHVSCELLKWEHSIYKLFYPHDKTLADLLGLQLHNHCTYYGPDGMIKYDTDGCRMSGDMNTGLGNCLLMCAMVYSYFADKCKIELINNGDDCVVFMETADLRHITDLPQWFLEMGFTMICETPVYELEEVEFCQCHPVAIGNDYLMVRNPNICLSKDLYTVNGIQSYKSWKTQLQALSDCGLALYGRMPVFNEFYRMMNVGGRHTTTQITGGMQWLSQGGLDLGDGDISSHTRFSFFKAFGLTPDEQIAIERYYASVTIMYHPGRLVFLNNDTILHTTRSILNY